MTALGIDATGVLLTGLRAQYGTGARFVTETPSDLETAGNVVRVARVGGPDDRRVLDMPTFVLDCFAAAADTSPASEQSRLLAYNVITALYDMEGQTVNGAVITYVRKLGGPSAITYENPAVRRQSLTFQVRLKPA